MPKRKPPRDYYTDWELWEMDGKLHVQLMAPAGGDRLCTRLPKDVFHVQGK